MTSTRSLFRTCAIPWRMLREPDIVAHANDPLIISFARLLLLLLLEDGLETVGRKNPKHVNSENKPEKMQHVSVCMFCVIFTPTIVVP